MSTMTLCHNCRRPAVAVVVLDQGYQIGRCCWSTPQQAADEQPVEPQQARQRKQRQEQH